MKYFIALQNLILLKLIKCFIFNILIAIQKLNDIHTIIILLKFAISLCRTLLKNKAIWK